MYLRSELGYSQASDEGQTVGTVQSSRTESPERLTSLKLDVRSALRGKSRERLDLLSERL